MWSRLTRRATADARRLSERWFERRYGSETSGYWYPESETGRDVPADCVWYDPTEWWGLRRALRRLHLTSSDVVVDIGSGKGRAVLVVASLPVGRVVGLERAASLTEIAQLAVERNRGRLACSEVALVNADALEFDLPDDTTVVYLYCPFVGEVFAAFIARLLAFADRAEHPVRLVYNYPFEHPFLIGTGRFRVVDVASATWPESDLRSSNVIVTYDVLPAPTDGIAVRSPGVGGWAPKGAECWLGPYDPGFVLQRAPGVVWRSSPKWRPAE